MGHNLIFKRYFKYKISLSFTLKLSKMMRAFLIANFLLGKFDRGLFRMHQPYFFSDQWPV